MNYYLISFDRSEDLISDIHKWARSSVQLEAEGAYSILAGPIYTKSVVMDCVADWVPTIISNCKYVCAKD